MALRSSLGIKCCVLFVAIVAVSLLTLSHAAEQTMVSRRRSGVLLLRSPPFMGNAQVVAGLPGRLYNGEPVISLEEAILISNEGDTISLLPGVYPCSHPPLGIRVNHSLTLRSMYPTPSSGTSQEHPVIFDCQGKGRAFWFDGVHTVTLIDLHFRNASVANVSSTLSMEVKDGVVSPTAPATFGGAGGAVLYTYASRRVGPTIVLSGCSFSFCSASTVGGAVAVLLPAASNTTYDDTKFGTLSGSAISFVQVEDSSALLGGGIAVVSSADSLTQLHVYAERLNCTRNSAAQAGAMFLALNSLVNTSSITLQHSSFVQNSAKSSDGGGILMRFTQPVSTLTFEVTNCTLLRNSAAGHGGGILVQYSSMVDSSFAWFNGNIFATNQAINGNGGGLCIIHEGPATSTGFRMQNCTLSNNQAVAGGGLWTTHDRTAEFTSILTSTVIQFNMARTSAGGAELRFRSHAQVTVCECLIWGNIGESDYGGGLYVHILSNGVLPTVGIVINILDSILGFNYVNSQSVGGGLYVSFRGLDSVNCSVVIQRTNFTGNSAAEGAGALVSFPRQVSHSLITVLQSTFQDNSCHALAWSPWGSAPNRAQGAGLLVLITYVAMSQVVVDSCTFTGNIVGLGRGGAGASLSFDTIASSTVKVLRSTFQRNEAIGGCLPGAWGRCSDDGFGGAGLNVYSGTASDTNTTVAECMFRDNLMTNGLYSVTPQGMGGGRGGGACVVVSVANSGTALHIVNSTFANNQLNASAGAPSQLAGAGLCVVQLGGTHFTVEISATTFDGNHGAAGTPAPSTGGGMVISLAQQVTGTQALLYNCTFTGNRASTGSGLSVTGPTPSVQFLAAPLTSPLRNACPECLMLFYSKPQAQNTLRCLQSTFTGNANAETAGSHGGGVYVTNVELFLEGSVLSSNTAEIGEGLFFAGLTPLHVNDTSLLANIATIGGKSVFVQTFAPVFLGAGTRIHMSSSTDSTADWLLAQAGAVLPDSGAQWLCPSGHTMDVNIQPVSPDYSLSQAAQLSMAIRCVRCPAPLYSLSHAVLRGALGADKYTPTTGRPHGTSARSTQNTTALQQVKCLQCPYGGDCSNGGADLYALAEFWGEADKAAVAATSTQENARTMIGGEVLFSRCPPGYCPDTSHPWDKPCTVGRLGTLCGSCAPGRSQAQGGAHCVPDSECSDAVWFYPVSVLLLAAYMTFFLWSSFKTSSGLIKVLVYCMQGTGVMLSARGNSQYAVFTSIFNMRVDTYSSNNHEGSKAVCAFRGMSTLQSLLMPYAVPIAGVLLMMGLRSVALCSLRLRKRLAAHVRRHKPSVSDVVPDPWSAAYLRAFLFAYSSLASTTRTLLHCVPLEGREGVYLFQAASVRCYTTWQVPLLVLFALLVFIPVGILVFVCWSSTRDRHTPRSSSQHALFTVLASPYRLRYNWWESVLLTELLLLSWTRTFVMTNVAAQSQYFVGVACSALLLQFYAAPFRERAVNAAQGISHMCWLVIAVSGLGPAYVRTIAAPQQHLSRLPSVHAAETAAVVLPTCVILLLYGWKLVSARCLRALHSTSWGSSLRVWLTTVSPPSPTAAATAATASFSSIRAPRSEVWGDASVLLLKDDQSSMELQDDLPEEDMQYHRLT